MCVRRFATHRPLLGARVHPSAWLTWQRRLGLALKGPCPWKSRGRRGGNLSRGIRRACVHVLLVKKNSKSKPRGVRIKAMAFCFFLAFGPPAAWSA
ncbi:hypothetical protein BKA56DRAFT_591986 [Ilyonectria sp. MPI-CAGE-AT-0026]|nr:hypothetical protein BKA56DRAFT_591986 [Ilyonectria sp. MPI-CAGE-AT-0026]